MYNNNYRIIKYVKNNNINATKVTNFVKKNHYTKSLARGCSNQYVLLVNNKIFGILMFGTPTGKNCITKYGQGTVELKRVVLSPKAQKNTASWFIAKGIKLLRKDKPSVTKILSYADQNQGHEGIIYKASNFTYLGQTKGTQYAQIEGFRRKFHLRTVYQKVNGGQLTKVAKLYKEMQKLGKARLKTNKPKHIYVYDLKR